MIIEGMTQEEALRLIASEKLPTTRECIDIVNAHIEALKQTPTAKKDVVGVIQAIETLFD